MPETRKKEKNIDFIANPPEKSANPQRKVLGTSKVQRNHRFTLIKSVRERLNAKVGDTLIFGEDEEGNLVIRIVKAQQKKKPEHI